MVELKTAALTLLRLISRPQLCRLVQWLRSPAGGVRAAEEIFSAGGLFSTSEADGAPRRPKACNPAGTNPADLDVTHALSAAGAAAVPALLSILHEYIGVRSAALATQTSSNSTEEQYDEATDASWGPACSAAALLGNRNALTVPELQKPVCSTLARCVTLPGVHRWVRRNAVEALGTAAQGITGDVAVEVARSLVRAITPHGEQQTHEGDQYDTEATVRVHAVLSVARLARCWRQGPQEPARDCVAELLAATPLLSSIAAGEDIDKDHRLGGTMGDYATHALSQLEART